MKKIIFSVLMLCGGVCAFAQLLNVSSVDKVQLPLNAAAYSSEISPNGNFVVLSRVVGQGLDKYDLTTSKFSTVSNNAVGYGFQILSDGETVVYRENKIGSDKLRRTSLKSINLNTFKINTIISETRELQGVVVLGNTVSAVNKGKLKVKNLGEGKTLKAPVASIADGQLCVTVNGKTRVISPNGTQGESYLWPSVSPDGTKVVYYRSFHGCYVSNIDGTNPVKIGYFAAPRWYNNNIVIGMNDVDNGEVVTSSSIVAVSANGLIKQTLTDDSVIALYPSTNGDKISFTTLKGELYIININK